MIRDKLDNRNLEYNISLEKIDLKDYEIPLSPLNAIKSGDLLQQYDNFKQNNNLLDQECSYDDESQKQFYEGAQIRKQIFNQINQQDQPNSIISENIIPSSVNIENNQNKYNPQNQNYSQSFDLNQVLNFSNNKNMQYQCGQNGLDEKLKNKLDKQFIENMNTKEIQQFQDQSLFNSSESRFTKQIKMPEDINSNNNKPQNRNSFQPFNSLPQDNYQLYNQSDQVRENSINYNNLYKKVKRADDHFQIIRRFPVAYEITSLIVTLVMIGQIAGCGFHLIAKQELEDNPMAQTWMQLLNINQQDWVNKYIASIYFAFITMITVGYGDIYPVTGIERVYVIVMTICSSAVFGYVMNTIGVIFQSQAKQSSAFKKRKQNITSYLNFRNINRQLQVKVLRYIDYQERIQQNLQINQKELFKGVPSSLMEEINQQYYGKFLLQNKILKINFSHQSIMALAAKMKEIYLGPNQYLLKEGATVNCVYFLIEGELDFVLQKKNKSQEEIIFSVINQAGEALGMRPAFQSKIIQYSLKSSKNKASKLMYFEMEDFLQVMQQYPLDYEKFCEIRDEIIYNKYSLDTRCQSCMKYNHVFEDCQLINIKSTQKFAVITRNTYSLKQERKSFKRKNIKFSTLKNQDQILESVALAKIQIFLQLHPEFVQDIDELYQMDLQSLFSFFPAFTYKEGVFQIDEEQNAEQIDKEEYQIQQNSESVSIHKVNKKKQNQQKEECCQQTSLNSFFNMPNPIQQSLVENDRSQQNQQQQSSEATLDLKQIQQNQQSLTLISLVSPTGNEKLQKNQYSQKSLDLFSLNENYIYSQHNIQNQLNIKESNKTPKHEKPGTPIKRKDSLLNSQQKQKILYKLKTQNSQHYKRNIQGEKSEIKYFSTKQIITLSQNQNLDQKVIQDFNEINSDQMKNYTKFFPSYNCKRVLDRIYFKKKDIKLIVKRIRNNYIFQNSNFGNFKHKLSGNILQQRPFLQSNLSKTSNN